MALPAGLASQALQVRFPIRDVRFAKCSPTGIVPFRRRMPHVFEPRQQLKLVSAAGLAPAVSRSQAEHVAPTLRAVAPANGWRRGLGSCGDGDRVPWNTYSIGEFGSPWQSSSLLYYERRLVGSAGNAPVRRFRLCFATPDLPSGSRIISGRKGRSRKEGRKAEVNPPGFSSGGFLHSF